MLLGLDPDASSDEADSFIKDVMKEEQDPR